MNDSLKPAPASLRTSRWLIAAGVYNLVWGAITICFPHLLFDLCGIPHLNYPEIWQCVGMIVGVYGIGYLIAAGDSRRHWPIVLVGFLGKIFGPLGFAFALWKGTFPPIFGLTILTNDLLWWIPFGSLLLDAARHHTLTEQPGSAASQHFVKESWIAAPPEVVFAFHESPGAIKHLIPPWEKMELAETDGTLHVGSRVALQGKVLGLLPVRWVAIHTEYDPPHVFADRQQSGPVAFWYHRHRCLDDGQGGTLLRDEVEFQVPLGALGQFLGGWLIRRKLDGMFAYRHDKTRQLIESGEWKSTRSLTLTKQA